MEKRAMNRRQFIKKSLALGIGSCFYPLGRLCHSASNKKKVLILGIDGMDVRLTEGFMRKGLLPNFQKIVKMGSIGPMATSYPPQSPVAWSNVIVGAPARVHGIYDFIHRDPSTMAPYLSTSKVSPPGRVLHIGSYQIPLSRGKAEILRKGKPFWDYLAERDIPATLFRMPANFPCESGKAEMVSGMGTPDLRGGYGSFTLFTTASERYQRVKTGGKVIPITFSENRAQTELPGPPNTLREGEPESSIPITIWRDGTNPVARILLQDHDLLLREGEWRDWSQVSFPMMGPLAAAKGICKLYLKKVHPEFTLYASPINIDPSDPVLPVVSSQKYGQLLTEKTGFFYTQGFPEDTKALSEGALTENEYLNLAKQVNEEGNRLLDFELDRFGRLDTGMLFFYFSTLDLNSHMYWRTIDADHPLYDVELHRRYGNVLKEFYSQVDQSVGRVLSDYDLNDPNFCLLVMSDHGFSPFRRQVNLNTWLHENGYLALNRGSDLDSEGYFPHVDWARSSTYSLGINAVYLNLRGRDLNGIVPESQAGKLRQDLSDKLSNLIDPATRKKVALSIRIVPESERRLHPHAPDLIVGWNIGYRMSWKSVLGGLEAQVFSDNRDKWSGDHCVAPSLVPAILISNRTVKKRNPCLHDVSTTVLDEFNIAGTEEMEGKSLFQEG
jgi:predicted AlkP superfamily phosphohydrolase/phosphomutase